jgi:hypothetical protein
MTPTLRMKPGVSGSGWPVAVSEQARAADAADKVHPT